MKVVVENLKDGYVQINASVRGINPIVLTKAGQKKEFATHGEFQHYFAGAQGMEKSGAVKVHFLNDEGKPVQVVVQDPKKAEPVEVAKAAAADQAANEAQVKANAEADKPVADLEAAEAPKAEVKTNKFAPKNKQKPAESSAQA